MATSRKKRSAPQSHNGLGVDAHGGPVVDPTQNVKDLSDAATARQDDLRDLTKELFQAGNAHVREITAMSTAHQKEISDLNSKHQRELDHAESERLDSIRQVDREDVNKTAAQALNAIQTLATTTSTTAETLRTQVATTALASQNQLATITGEINKRLSALELSLSEGKGKQAVADPQMMELLQEVRNMRQIQASESGKQAVTDPATTRALAEIMARVDSNTSSIVASAGKSAGGQAMWGYVAAGIAMLAMLFGLYTSNQPEPDQALAEIALELKTMRAMPPAAAPQVIYVPSPPGTLLPSTPPAPVPGR